MRELLGVSLFGLCEVDPLSLDALTVALADSHFSIEYPRESTGQLRFDTGLIYDRRVLQLEERRSYLERYAGGSLKLGELVSFTVQAANARMHVIRSHWPSLLTVAEFAAKRDELGMRLRRIVDDIQALEPASYVVLMGDYNAEPFSKSLSQHLLATRDRTLAAAKPELLYNPFWRSLGESLPLNDEDAKSSICGSYHYKSGSDSRWFTYDQMIFSSNFLAEGPLVLVETFSRILATSSLRLAINGTHGLCDHYPILSAVNMKVPL